MPPPRGQPSGSQKDQKNPAHLPTQRLMERQAKSSTELLPAWLFSRGTQGSYLFAAGACLAHAGPLQGQVSPNHFDLIHSGVALFMRHCRLGPIGVLHGFAFSFALLLLLFLPLRPSAGITKSLQPRGNGLAFGHDNEGAASPLMGDRVWSVEGHGGKLHLQVRAGSSRLICQAPRPRGRAGPGGKLPALRLHNVIDVSHRYQRIQRRRRGSDRLFLLWGGSPRGLLGCLLLRGRWRWPRPGALGGGQSRAALPAGHEEEGIA